ncbi:hypothetical protein [Micromonospora fulviviridis]|uniref:hypothetical protein n=1 Tax=Micromonospora fulviviridis TaxID=47860 RepID=UPI0037A57A85
MPTVPETKATWTNGVDPLDSTNLHAYLRDPLRFLMNKPVAELRASTGQPIPSGSFTPVLFNLEQVDTDPDGIGGHSTVTNTSRYTARYPGWYRVGGSVTWPSNATGRRATQWAVNGSTVDATQEIRPGSSAGALGSQADDPLIFLAEGDYLELRVWQDSGISLTLLSTSADRPRMTVEWERL